MADAIPKPATDALSLVSATDPAAHIAAPTAAAHPAVPAGESGEDAVAGHVSWRIRELVKVVDALVAATDTSRSHWSMSLFNKGNHIAALAAGTAGIRLEKYDAVMDAISKAWPDEAARPGALMRWEAETARALRKIDAATGELQIGQDG